MLFKLLNRYRQSIHTKRLARIYDDRCLKFGDGIESVGWRSRQRQKKRFAALVDHLDFSNKSILDIGCGRADLFSYLKDQYTNIEYCGCDISDQMIQIAASKFPDLNFLNQDFMKLTDITADIVIASGVFSHIQNWPYQYLKLGIMKCLELSNHAVVFNVLSSQTPKSSQVSDQFIYYKPEKVLKICAQLSTQYHLAHHYLDNDFTVTIYK